VIKYTKLILYFIHNVVLVSLSIKSSGEFMAQWWTGENSELELTKSSINYVWW
jgi:hypothetical protein